MCVSGSRVGSHAATSVGSVSHASSTNQFVGETDVDHSHDARVLGAGHQHGAELHRTERHRQARANRFALDTPVVPFTPEGMSTATIGACA